MNIWEATISSMTMAMENEGRKEFVNQLKKVWGDDAIAFENSKGGLVRIMSVGIHVLILKW